MITSLAQGGQRPRIAIHVEDEDDRSKALVIRGTGLSDATYDGAIPNWERWHTFSKRRRPEDSRKRRFSHGRETHQKADPRS